MAARTACASDFVEALEEGYETVIGDRGLRLSGGQQQRLALARAVLSNPEILVMDEATSALDTLSERLIQRALESMRHERTIVVIAHRLSTVANADQILVVEGGEIVEKGTIKELIDLDGQFARMWNSQSSKIEHGTNSHGIK
jgi:ABC-type multidrug transport system fused ATPase/permease subunit